MKFSKILLACGLVISFAACNNSEEKKDVVTNDTTTTTVKDTTTTKPDMHNAQNALDWNGTYEGLLPCASCEGIQSTITLNEDGTFTKVDVYKGKKEEKFEDKGKFTWDKNGTNITLDVGDGEANPLYMVSEGSLIMLDADGKVNTGELADKYILKKK